MGSGVVVHLHALGEERRSLALPSGQTLLASLRAAGVSITSICGGRAICGMCRIQVVAESLTLPDPSPHERRLLGVLPGTAPGQRLSCQIVLESEHDGLTIALAEPVRRSRLPFAR